MSEGNMVRTKQDLIEIMAEAAEIPKTVAEKAFVALTDAIVDTLQQNGKVNIANFGNFETTERAARTGRNPQTGAEIQIAASRAAKFKPSKRIKDAVNQ